MAPSYESLILEDFERFKLGLPKNLESYVLERYGISFSSTYGNIPVKNPFGKASGQLSLNANQIDRDAESGLGFAILKTVIAQDETGTQSMKAWAIPAARMTVEEIHGTRPQVRGEKGWTVTWKGRGWSETFESYLEFFDRAIEISNRENMLVVPSVKYHLPKPDESAWKSSEYEFTTSRLYDVWKKHSNASMPLEKDFSPTLAGDMNFSRERENILSWLCEVPKQIRNTSVGRKIHLGLKIFNAAHSDDFQLEMLDICGSAKNEERADFVIYGNRLFDPDKTYEGVEGVAYGGPDLSDRNLSLLSKWHHTLPISATGNITTGKMAFEYLRRGATSFQMHTLFQLPDSEFEMKGGTRTARALHRLLFHPQHGFLTVALHEKQVREWPNGISVTEMATQMNALQP